MPFFVPTANDDPAALGRRILARYAPLGSRAGRLSRAQSGLDDETFARLDADGDGFLDAAELSHFIDRPADVELRVRLGDIAPGREPLEILLQGGKPAPLASAVRKSGDGTLLLTFGKTLVELRRNEGRPRLVEGLRELYLARFRAADTLHKGHLTRQDAQTAQFFPELFDLLDQDGDGKLTEKELLGYLDGVQGRQAAALGSVTALAVSAEGRGLFDLLDRNRDGRLSLREVRDAPKLLARLGHEDGSPLGRDELPRSYQVALGLGQAGFGRTAAAGVVTPRGLPMLALDWSKPGMAWFHKMDRNGDGDISPREWLGTPEDFRRLDADGDGLISLEEAERAAEVFRKK
jgi:Ca2+-binding EF-hand superfamily protein